MTHAALSPLIGPEFDEFLGALIGEDRNGTTLTVLSALARLDVDPWHEATSLARMSREAAPERLTALIDALPRERQNFHRRFHDPAPGGTPADEKKGERRFFYFSRRNPLKRVDSDE